MKYRVPVNWCYDPAIDVKAIELGINQKFIIKCLNAFRGRWIYGSNSFNVEFNKYLFKEWQKRKNRSNGQKRRHYKRPEYSNNKPAKITNKNIETGKAAIAKIKDILK